MGEKLEAVVVVLEHVVVGRMEWEGKVETGEKEGWTVV